jgi:hypothetical protein
VRNFLGTTDGRLVIAVVIGVAITLALAIAVIATGAEAKDAVSLATAAAGLGTVAVGLVLAVDAFRLLYSKEHAKALGELPILAKAAAIRSAQSEGIAANPTVAGQLAAPIDISLDLNELLPKLMRTSAGLAIAVLLFGTILLVGASFSTPSDSANPSASPGASAPPSSGPSSAPSSS